MPTPFSCLNFQITVYTICWHTRIMPTSSFYFIVPVKLNKWITFYLLNPLGRGAVRCIRAVVFLLVANKIFSQPSPENSSLCTPRPIENATAKSPLEERVTFINFLLFFFRRLGAENLQTAVVPMWVVYQFLGNKNKSYDVSDRLPSPPLGRFQAAKKYNK